MCVRIHIHWDAHFPYGPMNFFTTHTHMRIHITWRLLLFVGNMFANICIFYTILLYNTLPHRFTFRLRLPRLPVVVWPLIQKHCRVTHAHPENPTSTRKISYLQLVFHHPPSAPDNTSQRLVIEPYMTAHT
ncbi:unnamed protein product [Aphis gossypii]|uniref:Uncharacterized protein n=1 Tax=Aphis gossypii TaxID=80765 RepID=A0A9P0IJJ4_APHGO|nr:unnamed protein product [Aphis gossypii]